MLDKALLQQITQPRNTEVYLNRMNTLMRENMGEKVVDIPITKMHRFKNHPFKVNDDKKMQEFVESVKQYGLITPGLVRPDKDGNFEIVAGHRRHHACELMGIPEMKVIVRDMSDDEAIIAMVDSNLQRETMLPSERAFAYKMKLDAMKRQGARNDLTSSQMGTKSRSDEILAEQTGGSRSQIQRYIRLTNLLPGLLEMVDNRKVSFSSAVDISYLTAEEQETLIGFIKKDKYILGLKQTSDLKLRSQEGRLTPEETVHILRNYKPLKNKSILSEDKIKKYFPPDYSPEQMEKTIIRLLKGWRKQLG